METGEGGKVAWLGGCFSLPGLCDSEGDSSVVAVAQSHSRF
jgi:hypothetical protein